eukprot:3652410-Rhodomonas_salina.1
MKTDRSTNRVRDASEEDHGLAGSSWLVETELLHTRPKCEYQTDEISGCLYFLLLQPGHRARGTTATVRRKQDRVGLGQTIFCRTRNEETKRSAKSIRFPIQTPDFVPCKRFLGFDLGSALVATSPVTFAAIPPRKIQNL